MTNEELDRLDALAKAATAGPWVAERGVGRAAATLSSVEAPGIAVYEEGLIRDQNMLLTADAEFIAAARDAVPALVAEVRRLRAALEKIAADEMGGDEWYVDTARKALEP